MNAATRTAARYCLAHGHTPLAIQNGFTGLLDDAIYSLTWLKVDSWMTRGGSELGTNRATPDEDLGDIASKFQMHGIDGLFLIGGFEAFTSLKSLEEARKHYPQFHIPMVHLPATLSNNVPVTEFSIGSDTSLNALVEACDAIKQSASSSLCSGDPGWNVRISSDYGGIGRECPDNPRADALYSCLDRQAQSSSTLRRMELTSIGYVQISSS